MSIEDWPVELDPTWGCWLWLGKIDAKDGYGLVWRGKSPFKAHVLVYQSEVGPVGDGLVLGHRCQVRRCVRPGHTKPMTQRENLFRRNWSYRVRGDLCDAKHDWINRMVLPTHGILCRLCDR